MCDLGSPKVQTFKLACTGQEDGASVLNDLVTAAQKELVDPFPDVEIKRVKDPTHTYEISFPTAEESSDWGVSGWSHTELVQLLKKWGLRLESLP
jgi:hypothetical protein